MLLHLLLVDVTVELVLEFLKEALVVLLLLQHLLVNKFSRIFQFWPNCNKLNNQNSIDAA